MGENSYKMYNILLRIKTIGVYIYIHNLMKHFDVSISLYKENLRIKEIFKKYNLNV